jgi:hypothetical protein
MKHESQIAFRREQPHPVIGNLCTRTLAAKVIASLRRHPLADIVAEMYPNDRALMQMITRAASNPATTFTTGWAAELVHRIVADTLEALGAASAAADVMKECLTLEWNGAGIISAPGFVASASNSGFVKEGDSIPVRQLAAGPAQLSSYKLATIAALSREMVESGNAEVLINDALVRSTGLALDAVFFDANAAVANTRPAGIRNGIAALTSSNNADAFGAAFEDIASLIGAVGQVGGKGPFLLVASAGRVASMRPRFIGSDEVIPVVSNAVGNDLIAIAPQGVVAAISAEPDVETTNAATLVMDTSPVAPNTTLPTKEMWQTDSIATKVRWPVSWALRDARAVAWLTPSWK